MVVYIKKMFKIIITMSMDNNQINKIMKKLVSTKETLKINKHQVKYSICN